MVSGDVPTCMTDGAQERARAGERVTDVASGEGPRRRKGGGAVPREDLDPAELVALGWTGNTARDQTDPVGPPAAPTKPAAPAPERLAPRSSPLSAAAATACGCLLRLALGLALLAGVLIAVLLAIPDGEDKEVAEDLSSEAQVGHWDAAFFCDDDKSRAERIMKATNYVARVAGLSHGHTDEAEACRVVRQSLVLTNAMHACVADLWRRRGVAGPVTPENLRQSQAWWNAVLVAALKSAPVAILERSEALHLALTLSLPWAVETLLERKVQVNSPAGPCQLTPMLRAARLGDEAAVQLLYRAHANVSAQGESSSSNPYI